MQYLFVMQTKEHYFPTPSNKGHIYFSLNKLHKVHIHLSTPVAV